jgi:hypothetical protein
VQYLGNDVVITSFSPLDSDEITVEFNSRTAEGRRIELIEVFCREGESELFVRIFEQPISAALLDWAIKEAAQRLHSEGNPEAGSC